MEMKVPVACFEFSCMYLAAASLPEPDADINILLLAFDTLFKFEKITKCGAFTYQFKIIYIFLFEFYFLFAKMRFP